MPELRGMRGPSDPGDDVALVVRSGELFDRVGAALDEVRPQFQADGGDVELVEVEDGSIAVVRTIGKCDGCPLSSMSVRAGLELHLRGTVPEILTVDIVSSDDGPQRTFRQVLDQAQVVESADTVGDSANR